VGYRFEEDKVQPVIFVEPRSDGFSAFEHDDYVISTYAYYTSLPGGKRLEIPFVLPVSYFYPEVDLMAVGPGSSVDELVQPFVVDEDNVYSFTVPFKGLSVFTLIDDFEGYADTNALRVVWVPSDVRNTPNTLVVGDSFGSKFMRIQTTKNNSVGDSVRRTFSSVQDWSQYTGVQFRVLCDMNAYMQFRIIDEAGSIVYVDIPQYVSVTKVYFPFTSFKKVGANFVDLSRIQAIEFYCANDSQATNLQVDDIYMVRMPNLILKYQLGEVQLSPSFNFVPLLFDDGSAYRQMVVTVLDVTGTVFDISFGVWDRSKVLDKGKVYGVRFFDFSEQGFVGVNNVSSLHARVLSSGTWVELDKNVAFMLTSELRSRLKRLLYYEVTPNNFPIYSGTVSGFLVKDGRVVRSLFNNQVGLSFYPREVCSDLLRDERFVVELCPFQPLDRWVQLNVRLNFRIERGIK
jgi:hypothetical protein